MLLLSALSLMGWRRYARSRASTTTASQATASTAPTTPASTPTPEPMPSTVSSANPLAIASAAAVAPSTDLQATIAANLVPGRMVFLDFILDARGLRLVGATGAAGRAKDQGARSGFGFVHYEVLGADGSVLLSSSVEDPTRRRIEYPAESNDGRIASKVIFSDEGPLAVRLPGEIPATRIVFYRDRNPLVPGGALGREPLGTFDLRPQP